MSWNNPGDEALESNMLLTFRNGGATAVQGALLLMHTHMGRNQSGAGKDNRLLFGEQWMLLFSKSKMATTNFSQSGA